MKKLFFLATFALALLFTSCDPMAGLEYPTLSIVNGSDYNAYVYFDNSLGATCKSGKNAKIELDCSINIPVLVVVEFYNSSNKYIGKYTWDDYVFNWNSAYKMTLTNSSSSSKITKYQ